MLFSSRRADDADVIRARLRALLAEGAGRSGWLPDDDPDPSGARAGGGTEPWEDDEDDSWTLEDPGPAVVDRRAVGAGGPERPEPPGAEGGPGNGGGRHRAAGPATRVDPGPHGARTLWVVAVAAAVLVAGWSWWTRPEVSPVDAVGDSVALPAASTGSPTGSTGPGATPTRSPVPTAAQIVVDVVGQVVDPGLVTLPAGARVADALTAAGGLLPGADPASINAAAVLTDGQQVAVGVPGAGGSSTGGSGSGGGGGGGGSGTGGPVDLNTATPADLDGLPGIGPVLAQRIVDHRTEHGRFTSVEQLDDVGGIGPALFAQLAPLVTV
ncbi:ComEA family DNA-binding protein [Klenkia sp. LSe6-5]|uniref:ComEA family DNA-binding protein n=1 Tax=Klenkia sesuvii TaxID=3103137 RepID=A0ABU8DXR1_9ACTN